MTSPAKLSPRGAAQAAASKSRRNALIAKIHVAKKQLDMDDTSYRAMLERITGKQSLTDCGEPMLDRVAAELVRLGFKPAKPRAAKPVEHRRLDTSDESSKIRAVWLLLHELGAVKNPSEASLAAYCKRITGVDDLAWLNDTQKSLMIETLKKWAVRVYPEALKAIWLRLHAAGLKPEFTDGRLAAFIAYYQPPNFAHRRGASFQTMRRAHYELTILLPKGEG